jgi:hypothetical protein
MNIKDIRIIQKLRNRTSLKEGDGHLGQMVVERWVEKTSWTLQIKRDGFAAEWEDVQVIEEFEEDV